MSLRVFVTGAARGIGRAIALELATHGHEIIVADRDREPALAVVAELRARGASAEARELDVTAAFAFEAAVDEVERARGPIDVLVNNAGIMALGAFLDQPRYQDSAQRAVNLDGVINGMRAVLPRMLARRRGHVINVASVAGRVGTPFAAVYSATKFAVIGLTEAVRQELDGQGVDLSYVMPGVVRTELIAGTRPPPWPPVASPEDVARAVREVLRTKQVDVYVPRVARLSVILPAILPRAIYERIGRALGVDRLFADFDPRARAGYIARTVARPGGDDDTPGPFGPTPRASA
jgi:short-subunit dehydrogenase